MVKFQPGDTVARSQHNTWWRVTCARERINPNEIFVVRACNKTSLIFEGHKFAANPTYFTLCRKPTKEEIIAARIKKLYSKCRTTAHWA